MTSTVDIIVVTWNLPEYLNPCLASILTHAVTEDLFRIILVNNGHPDSVAQWKGHPRVEIVQTGKNLGWEGGLKAGLAVSKAPYLVFMNDDTYIPLSSPLWINELLTNFRDPQCAAAGPSSNVVMGAQNIFTPTKESTVIVPFLVGFCLMVRREDLDAAGGVDDSLPGGDDLDLSIRLRKLGKYLVCDRHAFVYHHGFKSGTRKHGDYWNSAEMTQKTNDALIRKHGLKAFWETITTPSKPRYEQIYRHDIEGELVRRLIVGEKVLELGCGAQKTVDTAVGVDFIEKGKPVPGLGGAVSVADIVADVTERLPVEPIYDTVIARHILEHCLNPVRTIGYWKEALKPGGRLIVAVPDQSLQSTIPLNFQHVHAYTKESVKDLMESLGWETVGVEDAGNGISLVGVFKRV